MLDHGAEYVSFRRDECFEMLTKKIYFYKSIIIDDDDHYQ